MQYLVQMTLVAPGRPTSASEGATFIEEYILPTLELCQNLQSEKRIIGGGPMSGAVGLVLLVQADSAKELDDLITSMPVWSRMETASDSSDDVWGAGADSAFQAGTTQDANESGMSCR